MPDYPYLGDTREPSLAQMITYSYLLVYVKRDLIPWETFDNYRMELYKDGVDSVPCYLYFMNHAIWIQALTGEVL